MITIQHKLLLVYFIKIIEITKMHNAANLQAELYSEEIKNYKLYQSFSAGLFHI